jgi:hypothetical protein
LVVGVTGLGSIALVGLWEWALMWKELGKGLGDEVRRGEERSDELTATILTTRIARA